MIITGLMVDNFSDYILLLLFSRGFSFFQSKIEILPVNLNEVTECLPGAEIKSDVSDQNQLLTIVTKVDPEGSRIIALKFYARDERNTFLNKLR
jgi:hypothetical protein